MIFIQVSSLVAEVEAVLAGVTGVAQADIGVKGATSRNRRRYRYVVKLRDGIRG
jgi:hypothetical protein